MMTGYLITRQFTEHWHCNEDGTNTIIFRHDDIAEREALAGLLRDVGYTIVSRRSFSETGTMELVVREPIRILDRYVA